MSTTHLTITAAEEPRLLQVMKDIQETVAAYYAETARGGDLGAHVRTWLTRVQTLNDLLTEQLGDKATYTALFATPVSAGAELINAVKYARNVDQHLMHIVAPSEDSLIGGTPRPPDLRLLGAHPRRPRTPCCDRGPRLSSPRTRPTSRARRSPAPCSRCSGSSPTSHPRSSTETTAASGPGSR